MIAIIFALLLVLAIPLSIVSYDVGRVVFNPPLVKQVITDLLTESDLIPVALEWYSVSRAEERYEEGEAQAWQDEPDMVQLMSKLDTEDWKEIRELILPNYILTDWIHMIVDDAYTWIDNEEPVPQITLSLIPVIDRLDEDHEYGQNAILIAYRGLDPCNDEQIADYKARQAVADGDEVLYNLCQFPGTCQDDAYSYGCDQLNDYVESLGNVVSSVPDKIELTKELTQAKDTELDGLLVIKNQLRLIRLLVDLTPLIPLALLLLVLLFAVRSLKGLGMWWGIPITLGSLITFIIALLYRPLLAAFLMSGSMSEIPALIRAASLEGMTRLMAVIFQPMPGQSIVALLLGIVLIIVMIIAKPAREK